MELDEMKAQLSQVKAPAASAGRLGTAGTQAGDLIRRLQELEAQEQRRLRTARVLSGVAAALFSVVVAVPFLDPKVSMSGPRVLYGAVLAAVFALQVALASLRLLRLSRLEYSRPAREFLAEAEGRYVFYTPGAAAIALVGLAVLGVSAGAYVVDGLLPRYLPRVDPGVGLAGFAGAYLLLCLLGLYFTWGNWRRDRAPLLAQIRQARAALEDAAAPEEPGPGD
jgi:CDP-diglyceride synthetase